MVVGAAQLFELEEQQLTKLVCVADSTFQAKGRHNGEGGIVIALKPLEQGGSHADLQGPLLLLGPADRRDGQSLQLVAPLILFLERIEASRGDKQRLSAAYLPTSLGHQSRYVR